MSAGPPTPGQTLAVLLGASIYRYAPKLARGPAFYNSSQQFGQYLTETMGIPELNVTSFFDEGRSAGDQLRDVRDFLERRINELKNEGTPARDLIIHYVGHGLFSGRESDYCLAIRATDERDEGFTSIRMRDLAGVIHNSATFMRKFLILDCCFSGAAYTQLQSGPLNVVEVKVRDVLQDESPQRGTTLLCSASAKDPSIAPKGLPRTMFSDSLLAVLTEGSEDFGPQLSMSDIGELVRVRIKEAYKDMGVRPEVHSPDQRSGDVARMPLFPNPARSRVAARKEEAERAATENAEAERAAREQAEAEKLAQKRAEARAKAERAAREKAEQEKAEQERLAQERAQAQAEAERIAREKAETERLAQKRAETQARAERAAREKAEAERLAQKRAEAQAEADAAARREKRQEERGVWARAKLREAAHEKPEEAGLAQEGTEAQAKARRAARDREEEERLAQQRAEARAKAERAARKKAEADRLAQERAEAQAVAEANAEAERKIQEEQQAAREQAKTIRREFWICLISAPVAAFCSDALYHFTNTPAINGVVQFLIKAVIWFVATIIIAAVGDHIDKSPHRKSLTILISAAFCFGFLGFQSLGLSSDASWGWCFASVLVLWVCMGMKPVKPKA